jgi:hypothetical protein
MATATRLLGPLTSIFSPPSTCYDLTVSSSSGDYDTVITTTVNGTPRRVTSFYSETTSYLEMFDFRLDTDCYPEGHGSTFSGYFSPGVCPESWVEEGFTVIGDETTINCCPKGYTIDYELCRRPIGRSTTEVIEYLSGTRLDDTPRETVISAGTIWVSGIQVRYRDEDEDLIASIKAGASTTSPSRVGASAADTNGPTSSSGALNTINLGSGGNGDGGVVVAKSGGLSTGAKIGIGIGVPVAAILLGIGAFLIWYRHHRAKSAAAVDPAAPYAAPPGGPSPPVYPTQDKSQQQYGAAAGVAGVAAGAGYFAPTDPSKAPDTVRSSELYGTPSPPQPVYQPYIQPQSPHPSQVTPYPQTVSPELGSPEQAYAAGAPVQRKPVAEVGGGYPQSSFSGSGPVPGVHELYPETTPPAGVSELR